MKQKKYLFLLTVLIAFTLISCTDKTQPPVAPADQASLQKNFTREFTATNIPGVPTNPGIIKYPDGKTIVIKHAGPTMFAATFSPGDTGPDILSGPGEVEINGITDMKDLADPSTWGGNWRGKFVLTPENAGGGIWKFTWHGASTFSPTAWMGTPGWILPLQQIGHGEGGDINGMQCRTEVTIYCALDFSGWYGDVTGVITSH